MGTRTWEREKRAFRLNARNALLQKTLRSRVFSPNNPNIWNDRRLPQAIFMERLSLYKGAAERMRPSGRFSIGPYIHEPFSREADIFGRVSEGTLDAATQSFDPRIRISRIYVFPVHDDIGLAHSCNSRQAGPAQFFSIFVFRVDADDFTAVSDGEKHRRQSDG